MLNNLTTRGEMDIEAGSICRLCLVACHNFTKIEKAYSERLHMLLPFLDLTVSRDPVMCQICFQLMQKYLTCKATSLDSKNLQKEVKDVCLFCKKSSDALDASVCLNSQDMEVLLLRTVMEKYFPELELQINADLLIICSMCHKDMRKVIDFLIHLKNLEHRIDKYCQTVGIFVKEGINLEDIPCINGETVENAEVNSNSIIVKLEADQYIKQEPSEDTGECNIKVEEENIDYKTSFDCKPTEMLNEGFRIVEQKIKLEYEASEAAETDINVADNLKLEQENIDIKSMNYDDIESTPAEIVNVVEGWIDHEEHPATSDDKAHFASMVDHIQESIERVVRKCYYKYCPIPSDDETEFPSTGDHVRDSIERVVTRCSYGYWSDHEEFPSACDHTQNSGEWVVKRRSYECCPVLSVGGTRFPFTGDPIRDSIERVVRFKYEHCPIWSDDETVFPSTGDLVRDSIERVVKSNNKSTARETESLKDQKKEEGVRAENNKMLQEKQHSQIKVKTRNMHARRWWRNTSVISSGSITPQYFSKTELRAMISSIRVSGEKKYQCQVCQFIARAKCSMNRHMKLHENPSELETFQCHDCGYKANSKCDLIPHMITHRERSRTPLYRCPYCPFSAKMRNNLRRHLINHDAVTDVTMFECYTCGFKACRKDKLLSHIKSHRRAIKPQRL